MEFDKVSCGVGGWNKAAVLYETRFKMKIYMCAACYLKKETSKPTTHKSSIQAVKQDKLISF